MTDIMEQNSIQNEVPLPASIERVSTRNKDKTVEYLGSEYGVSLSSNAHLKRHKRNVHLKKKYFECSVCPQKFTLESNKRKHVRAVHDKIKDHTCDACQMSFSQKHHLSAHVKAVHLKVKDHVCEQCSSSFSTKGILMDHVNGVHLNEKNFKCEQCPFSCSWKASLISHIKRIHDKVKKHECEECGVSFAFISVCWSSQKKCEHLCTVINTKTGLVLGDVSNLPMFYCNTCGRFLFTFDLH